MHIHCNSYTSHIYTAKTRLNFCTSTRLCNAVNQSIFRFIRSIYMHHNHIHCKDTTQSLLIYTERQQRLCARTATNIRHSHSHYKDTTQLLHTYTSMQCSKSIDFSIFWMIYMRWETAYWRKNRNQTLLRLKVAQRTTLFQRSKVFLIKSLSVLPFLDAQGNKSRSVVTILSEITQLLRYLKYKAIALSIFYQKE